MNKLIAVIFLSLIVSSCSKKALPQTETDTKETSSERIVYVPHDSIITRPGDTVHIHDTIHCPGLIYHKEAVSKSGKTTATVDIKDNQLDVDCKTDSLEARIKWLEEHSYKEHTITKTITITNPPKWYIPKWVKILIAVNILYVIARIAIMKYKLPIKL